MPEEASESLVKVYLESKDYLVTTNKKIRIRHKVKTRTKKGYQMHNSAYEVDIIAINPKTKDKIIGEVKGWRSGMHKYHFRRLQKPTNDLQKSGQRGLKIINNRRYRNQLKRKVEEVYGTKNFKIVLFVNHINNKDEDAIKKLMKRENFNIITFGEILEELDIHASKFSYTNDPVLQLLRIQKRVLKRLKGTKKKK